MWVELPEVTVVMSREAQSGLVKFDVPSKSDFADTEDVSGMSMWVWCKCLEESGTWADMSAEVTVMILRDCQVSTAGPFSVVYEKLS